jgi:hypothetical protein
MTSEKAESPIGVVVTNFHTTGEKFKIYQKCLRSKKTIDEWREDYFKSIIYQGPCFMCEFLRGEKKKCEADPWNNKKKLTDPNIIGFLTNSFDSSKQKIVLNSKKSVFPIEQYDGEEFAKPMPTKIIQSKLICDGCMMNNEWFITLKKMYPPESDCTFVDIRGCAANRET